MRKWSFGVAFMLTAISLSAMPLNRLNLFAASIYPSISDSVIGTADTVFDVTVQVEEALGLFGASFELNFDKTYLNVLSESAGSFLESDVIFISQNDNVKGTVGIGITKKAGQNAAWGSGDLARIRFKFIKSVAQDTMLSFTLSAVTVNDSLGNPITISTLSDTMAALYPYAFSVAETSWAAPAEGALSSPIAVANSRSGEAIEYSIAEPPVWLSVSPTNGSTPGAFTLAAEPNRTGLARIDTVTIAATFPSGVLGSPRTIMVTQESTLPELMLSETGWTAPAGGGAGSLVHVTNAGSAVTISYTVSENADWLSVSASIGITPGGFIVTAEANHTGNVREDTVTVTAVSPSGVSNFQQKVMITQHPLPRPAMLRPVCPDSVTGTQDTEFDVWVEIEKATNLFGVDFMLRFDNTWLNVILGKGESFLGANSQFIPFMDNSTGRITVHAAQNPGQGGADGSGNVALFRFKVIRNVIVDTTLSFVFSSVAAIDSAMSPIDIVSESGSTRLLALKDGIDKTGSSQPSLLYLHQNSPNPFNPTTTIRYSIPKAGGVTLEVFDGLGRLIATLTKGNREAGEHQEVFDSNRLPSGLYYYRLEAGGSVLTRKMMLVR